LAHYVNPACHIHHHLTGESQTNVEITNEDDWDVLLRMEEEWIENVCAQIVACKPDIVITEKGVSDLTQHYLLKVLNRGGFIVLYE